MTKEIKDLFQQWIDEYSVSYLIHRKKMCSACYAPTQISVKELDNFIFISSDFEENKLNDWFIVLFNRENRNIYCINTQTLADAPRIALHKGFATYAIACSLSHTFALGVEPIITVANALTEWVERGWLNKLSTDQFKIIVDITKGNYAQFETLVSKLNENNNENDTNI